MFYSWMLWSHSRGLYSNRLSQIFSFYLILSDCFRLRTVRRFPTGTHLSHNLHISQTHVCLMANLILLNLTLFLIVHFCAMHGYAATHMCFPHVMLLFHSATTIQLHHVINPCYSMSALDSVNRSNTNMYYKLYDSISEKELTDNPSLILLEFPL